MDLGAGSIGVAVLAGLACGFLNTVASSGSAVSLPILLSLGLSPTDANATNRLPVLVGAVTATLKLARSGVVPWHVVLVGAVPTTIGAGVGALIAAALPGKQLQIAIVVAVMLALVLILTKLKDIVSRAQSGEVRLDLRAMAFLFAVGAWLGFIVLDGATYLLLVLVLAVRLPLVAANAAKNALMVPTTVLALTIFGADGDTDWVLGGIMSLGSVAGGYLGARLALSEDARRWIVGLLVTIILAELVHLLVHMYMYGWTPMG